MQVDAYLDELLAARSRAVAAVDEASAEVARAAAVVRDALVRFHPSSRFEEALATRLRAVAAGTAQVATIVRFPSPIRPLAAAGLPADDTPRASAAAERGWVLVGGAIASGVSLVAGVLLARRRSRAEHRVDGPD